MASQKKNPASTDRQTTTLREAATSKPVAKEGTKALPKAATKAAPEKAAPAKPDATSAAHKVAKVVGNQQMNARLADSTERRDVAMGFIIARLRKVQQRQDIELEAVGNRDKWERQLSLEHHGYKLPTPTRWHECAHLFKQAAQALCSGNLSRGAQLLDQALEAERVAQDSYPEFLLNQARMDPTVPYQGPDEVQAVDSGEGCPKMELPKGIHIADKIMAVRTDADPVRERQPEKRHDWWQKEEDDGDKPEDGAKKKKPTA